MRGNPGTAPIQVTDFDVLATEFPGREYVLWVEYNKKKHVGNNRLNVLVDIHAESFRIHSSKNNQYECDKIVGMIQDATFKKRYGQSCNPSDCGDCNNYRGRFLVKEMAADDNIDWSEQDENSCKRLIVQTLLAKIEERRKNDLFEPIDVLSSPNSRSDNIFVFNAPPLRRSRSASNLSLDAKNAFGELFSSNAFESSEDPFEPLPATPFSHMDEIEDEIEEPLPITSSPNFNEVDLDIFGNLNNELNNRKKRGRRPSLLRRSNSFDAAFDKKKTFKNFSGAFQTSTRRQPSFIRSYSVTTPNVVSSADHFATSALPEVVSSGPDYMKSAEVRVPMYQGMDIVLQSDRKTLNTSRTIVGNNRLRILLELESGRFNLLLHDEKQKTATNLQRTITEMWKGRILAEDGSSYRLLIGSEATDAIYSLLLGGNKTTSGRNRNQGFSTATPLPPSFPSSTSSPHKPSSLLAAAPQLPDYLRNASKEILRSGKKKYSNEMTARERQAAAIEALKERNKSRQLAKEKARSTD